jgi:hypothetical protein
MDSNFQVTITANIQDLVSRVSAIEKELGKISSAAANAGKSIKSSFDTASVSVSRVGVDMNRARLATFAFGQVIRDAGFFSQSFGLGMLAISNNIPILIDQLVLLAGVSAGLGAALSLVGSLVAAAATVFAYWAQGVQRDGGTVSGAINAMVNDSESALGRLVEYFSKPPASEILSKAVNGVKEGMDAISKIIDAGVTLAIALWERFGPAVMIALNAFFSMAKNVMLISLNLLRIGAAIVQGDWSKALKSIGNIGKLVFNNLIEFAQAYIGLVTKGLGAIIKLYDPLKGTMLQVAGQQFVKLGDSFKFATEDLSGFNFDLLSFVNNLFNADKQAAETTKSIDSLSRSVVDLKKVQSVSVSQKDNMPRTTGNVVEVNLRDAEIKKAADDLNLYMELKGQEMASILNNGMVAAVSNSMFAIGEAFATGGNAAKAFGVGMLSTISEVLSQLADKLIAASLAGLLFSTAMKNLFNPKNWALALAAGIALKIAAGAAGGFARSLSGGAGGNTSSSNNGPTRGSFGSVRPFASGGIISGDTLGLMGEYPNARSNPEVVAPLDKLTSLISGSIGDMGGNMGGQLTARISGNDLVILLDRASKNRKNYF